MQGGCFLARAHSLSLTLPPLRLPVAVLESCLTRVRHRRKSQYNTHLPFPHPFGSGVNGKTLTPTCELATAGKNELVSVFERAACVVIPASSGVLAGDVLRKKPVKSGLASARHIFLPLLPAPVAFAVVARRKPPLPSTPSSSLSPINPERIASSTGSCAFDPHPHSHSHTHPPPPFMNLNTLLSQHHTRTAPPPKEGNVPTPRSLCLRRLRTA